jgi:hypothetical protein
MMLATKLASAPSCAKVSRKAPAAHGPACPCCRGARRVSVRASAAAPQSASAAAPAAVKDGLVRLIDEEKVRPAGGPMGAPARPHGGVTWADYARRRARALRG